MAVNQKKNIALLFLLTITCQFITTSKVPSKNLTLTVTDIPLPATPLPLVAPSPSNENAYKKEEIEAKKILEDANSHMTNHWSRLRDIFLSSNQKLNSGTSIQQFLKNYRHFVNELAMNLSLCHVNYFENDDVKRQVKFLSKLQLQGLSDAKYEKAMNSLHALKGLTTSKHICQYGTDENCKRLSYLPTVNEFIEKSQNENKLKYYWNEWRNVISADAKKHFLNYVDLFREAAMINGHFSPSRTWYLYYEDDNFLNELENAVKQIMPIYKEFHAYVRNLLRNKYGKDKIREHGPIGQHLMEQVISHAWRAKALFQPPYPNAQLPNIKVKMDEQHYTSTKVIDIAARFYNTLGLPDLPDTFWTKFSRKISNEEAGNLDDCKAQVFNFPPDAALKYCPKVDFKKFIQMHGHMAEIHYNYQRNHFPIGLNQEACPGFSDAIGEAAVIASGSPRHLERIELWDNYTLDDHLSTNRLFRMGVHTIFTVPMYFINEKFFVNVLDNRIPAENLNCAYWDLQDEFAGVAPPGLRSNGQFDVGFKFYSGINPEKSSTRKLISELLGYQFYRALCIKCGQYVPGDDSHPLHNCDFSESKEAGKYIRDMMALGSTKNWRDVMEILTGERKISANAILEYYQPLHAWLKRENLKHNVQVGWDESDRCDEDADDS